MAANRFLLLATRIAPPHERGWQAKRHHALHDALRAPQTRRRELIESTTHVGLRSLLGASRGFLLRESGKTA
jgi:hypothetical protein